MPAGGADSKDVLRDGSGNLFARSGAYRIMRVCERFPDLDKANEYIRKFSELDPEEQNNFLAYCRIRELEEAEMRGIL